MGREDGEGGPVVYEIRVAERVSDRWSAWFGGMALDPLPDGEGEVPMAKDGRRRLDFSLGRRPGTTDHLY